MPIAPLPKDTVRLLGSQTVITTPVHLIKELLDNSIDAKATSVDIRISPNTVDRIDVRDNGHGIHQDDFDFLGRPGHTSKITSFYELHTIGGTTLGFRGQALASANSLGTVNITTKTTEDPTGVLLKLRPGVGGVDSKQLVPASVGTTVSTTGLFSSLPVREQVTIKESPKNIAKLKHLLYAYALAKPDISLSLKILGGNNRWSYSPRPQATVREATIQLFGTELMSQCLIRTMCSGHDDTNKKEKFTIEAVLPSSDGDLTKVSRGAFFSVDSRPLSTAHGTMKKLLSTFKTYLFKSLGEASSHKHPKEPFIRVNINCSAGAYDPNIEPSKNEVLFANESRLVDLFERLCAEVYKPQETLDAFSTIGRRQLFHHTQVHTPPLSSDGPGENHKSVLPFLVQEPQLHTSPPSNLGAANAGKPDAGCTQKYQKSRVSENALTSGSGNPSPLPGVCSSPKLKKGLEVSPRSEREPLVSHSSMESRNTGPNPLELNYCPQDEIELPLHRSSISNQALFGRGVVDMSMDPDMLSDEEIEMLTSRFRGRLEATVDSNEDHETPREALNPWKIAKITVPARQEVGGSINSRGDSQDRGQVQDPMTSSLPDGAFEDLPILRPRAGLPGDIGFPHATPLGIAHTNSQQQLPELVYANALVHASESRHEPQDVRQAKPQLNGRHTQYNLRSSHRHVQEGTEPDGLVQTTLSFGQERGMQQTRPEQPQLHIDDIPPRSNLSYRKPKKANTRNTNPKPSDNPRNTKTCASNQLDNYYINEYGRNQTRYQGYSQAIHRPNLALSSQDNHVAQHPVMPPSSITNSANCVDGNPRRSLMTEHKKGHQLLKRANTDMLPLERVPEKDEMQRLVLLVMSNMDKLKEAQGSMIKGDLFSNDYCREIQLSDELGLDDVTEIESRLKSVLAEWTERTLGERTELELNIRNMVKGKAIAV